ncbi:MAG: hypothetical protein KC731_17780 [Myxococcales bacterium]|nr:hypothetical protein [Myxococcales bacterium]
MPSIDQLTISVQSGNPDVTSVFVFDASGRVTASSRHDDLLEVATAMMVPLRDLLEHTAAAVGCGAMRATLLVGTEASLAIADIDGERAVGVVGRRGAPPGSLMSDALWLADALATSEAA